MSFGGIEKTRYKGRPTNLFLVRYGAAPNSFYAYTDAEKTIINGGIEYTPIAITRGKITASGTLDKSQLEVRATLNIPLAEHFRVYPPSQVVNITIYQGHLSDPDSQFLVAYAGRVVSAKRDGHELVLSCEPVSTSLKRIGLRRHYQYSCPHALYGERCQASKAAATMGATVESVNGTTIVLPDGWVTPERASKYVNGMVEWENKGGDTEIRTILQVGDGRHLIVSGTTRDLKAGSPIRVILGCNHGLWKNANGIGLDQKTDCHFVHNNIKNFGGCFAIPTKNPIGLTNQFY
ncbi:hypothetical protein ABDF71_21880 [Ochrobactrum sp. WV_118_8]